MTDETTPTQPSLATFLQGSGNTPASSTPVPSTSKPGTPKSAPAATAVDDTVIAPELELKLPPAVEQAEVGRTEVQQANVEAGEMDPGQASALDGAVVADSAALQSTTVHSGNADESEDEANPASAAAAPSFARENRAQVAPPVDTPRWQWGVVLALALLLGLQIILADRSRLAADASTRPLVSGLCSALRCTLPPWHEPSAFSMLSRDIRPVPGLAGALQVQASFRNDARWAQAWPALRLSLSDADGRVIGRRTLQPAEYLGPTADPQARLEPGQSAQVSFRLREPAAATVAFSFEFQ